MSIYSQQIVLPKMRYQTDEEIVYNALMDLPTCHRVELDWVHHLAIIHYCDPDSLPDIYRALSNVGFPALSPSDVVH